LTVTKRAFAIFQVARLNKLTAAFLKMLKNLQKLNIRVIVPSEKSVPLQNKSGCKSFEG